MGKIQVLSPEVAVRIAAGEIIERPASMVKELIENSLDAGAGVVSVQMEEGGVGSLTVQDDGEGLDDGDVGLAFVRHATSKIRSDRDLQNHMALGFRGEALASIASVSQVDLVTCQEGENAGRSYTIRDGNVDATGKVAWPQGTRIRVAHLFYNAPARLHHLGATSTETSHVIHTVQRLVLANPKVKITLMQNKRFLLDAPGDGELRHALHAVFGGKVAQAALPTAVSTPEWSIEGLVVRPTHTRSDRRGIVWVINGRCVRSDALSQALLRGYETLLQRGRYPVAVLHVRLDPQRVDANVHPAKQVVRLRCETELGESVTQLVRRTWREAGGLLIPPVALVPAPEPAVTPSTSPVVRDGDGVPDGGGIPVETRAHALCSRSKPGISPSTRADGRRAGKEHGVQTIPYRRRDWETHSAGGESRPAQQNLSIPDGTENIGGMGISPGSLSSIPATKWPRLQPVGQIHATYIVAEAEDGMYLIDQHAAHERVHYERLCTSLQGADQGSSQVLLLPISVELPRDEAYALESLLPSLAEIGIEVDFFGESTFLIRSYPAVWSVQEATAILPDWLTEVARLGKSKPTRWLAELASRWSCRASIKAQHRLSTAEMESLLQQWMNCQQPATCPHGRPVVVRMASDELAQLFRRGR
ncbi:DNA mismatch repair endonuclease MutL [Pasteuria penetrans]|uniref:DNA mismatch repair endonuclease MutL n=1 Tax=Pasteuria penetrans TaxID=86005 RepID=UPI000FA465D0|nr:DNA mismatch repair endonuclease MutL [Pasteuria penetrans]